MVTFKALVTQVGEDNKAYLSLEDVELGLPDKNQVLVRIHVVAQNPTDGELFPKAEPTGYANDQVVQSLDSNAFGEGVVLGCDFAGTVEALGQESTLLKIGDVVSGFIWGGTSNIFCEMDMILTILQEKPRGWEATANSSSPMKSYALKFPAASTQRRQRAYRLPAQQHGWPCIPIAA